MSESIDQLMNEWQQTTLFKFNHWTNWANAEMSELIKLNKAMRHAAVELNESF